MLAQKSTMLNPIMITPTFRLNTKTGIDIIKTKHPSMLDTNIILSMVKIIFYFPVRTALVTSGWKATAP